MFYRALGYVVWNGGKWYVRRRWGGTVKIVASLAVATVAATIAYVFATGNDE
jgi:hypothetical protein